MILREIFANSTIFRAHIIDDAYDDMPSFGITAGAATRFVQELEEDAFDLACSAIGLVDAKEQQFIEALADCQHVQKLFMVRDKFGDHSKIIFGDHLTDKETKKRALDPLISLLEANGVECKKFGISYPVETTEEPHFVFIDLRLIEDGSPISVDAAVAVCRKLRNYHQSCQPFFFLMSTLIEPLKQRREEFRLQANLFASQFESLEKRLFTDVNELAYVLARYARVLPQLSALQKSIEDVGEAVHAAVSKVKDELKNLDLADYFVLHRNTVSIEKVGLGTYVSDLVLEYLVHEVENTSQIWQFAHELDKLKPENLPRSRFSVTPAAGKIYSGTLLHAKGRLDSEGQRELGPSHGYFYLGDIFFSAKELNESVPKKALVIATPACDLVRPETLRQRTIFLCEGKVQLLSPSSVPAGNDGLPGVIVNHPTDSKKQLLINWNKKKLHTWHSEEIDDFKKTDGCKWVRIGRLRPLYAVQIQHAITADLSRIGVQRAPNVLVPHGVEVLIKKDGKWTVLDNTDVNDATTAAFSESEDKSKTIFVFSDKTVYKIRQKIRLWIEKNQSKAVVMPAAEEISGKAVQPDVEAYSVSARTALLNSSQATVESQRLFDNTNDLESNLPSVELSQPMILSNPDIHVVHQAEATGCSSAETKFVVEAGQSLPATTEKTADLLRKIMGISDFEQRLMYSEQISPSKNEVSKSSENCAFPLFDVMELSCDERQSFVIIRPGKSNIYESISGGQLAKKEQTATVVLKLVKVK